MRISHFNVISEDIIEMLEECRSYYSALYSNGPEVNPNEFLSNVNVNTLARGQLLETELSITIEELYAALKSMNGSTSPGPDGYTVPFYKTFWNELGALVFDYVNECYKTSTIPEQIRDSITILIPKKNKDTSSVESFRSISLLNVFFKIMTKSLARRVARVIDTLINEDQTAFIKGRFIGENVRMALDVINFARENDKKGLFPLCDWEKAYDSVSWEYLRHAVRKFGFGPNFLRWVDLVYPSDNAQSISAQIQLNGHLSRPYQINRGLRQGCPLSCSLFLMCIEPLLERIRSCRLIKGFSFGDTEIKVSAYADDLLLITDGEPTSLRESIKCMNEFYIASGLKLNDKKTRPMWIGPNSGVERRICPEIELGWRDGPAEYLGVLLNQNERDVAELNYARKINALKGKLAPWGSKGLTPYGKVHILKTEALSQLTYLMSVLSRPSVKQLSEINRIIFKFIWETTDKIKRKTLMNDMKKGGLTRA